VIFLAHLPIQSSTHTSGNTRIEAFIDPGRKVSVRLVQTGAARWVRSTIKDE
jgi:hypothetical protein